MNRERFFRLERAVPLFKKGQVYVFDMDTSEVRWVDAAGNIVDTPLRPGLAGYLWLLRTEKGFFEEIKEVIAPAKVKNKCGCDRLPY